MLITPFRDLRTCNDKLVSFIEKAGVLAEALDVKSSLPEPLSVHRVRGQATLVVAQSVLVTAVFESHTKYWMIMSHL